MSMINTLKKHRETKTKNEPKEIKIEGLYSEMKQQTTNKNPEIRSDFDPIFAFISDTHINAHQYHLPQRADDIFDTFKQAIDIIDNIDPELPIIHGGDLFNSYSVKPSVIIKTSQLIDGDRMMYIIRGNHDGSPIKGKRKDTALNLVDEINKRIRYVESDIIQLTNTKTINFIMQSYVGDKTMDKLRELKGKMDDDYRNSDYNILAIHDIVEGLVPFGANIDRDELRQYIRDCNIDMVLTGHLHIKKIDEDLNLLNPGSIECLDIDQADQERGFFLVGIDGQTGNLVYRWMPLQTRNMEDIEIDLGNIESRNINRQLRDKIKRITIQPGSVVRFKITGTTDNHLPRIDKTMFSDRFPNMLKIMVSNKIRFENDSDAVSDMLEPRDAVKKALKDMGADDEKIDEMADAMIVISKEASDRNEGWRKEIRKAVKDI